MESTFWVWVFLRFIGFLFEIFETRKKGYKSLLAHCNVTLVEYKKVILDLLKFDRADFLTKIKILNSKNILCQNYQEC